MTGENLDQLKNIGDKIFTLPEDMNFHPQIKKIYEARYDSVKKGTGIDWGTAEALAWASLIEKGNPVRISGQDVERGTFSHRHAVLYDQNVYKKYVPLHKMTKSKNQFQACNSHLSEFGVLGFELGFSYYNPEALTIWEAQFGDFANGAQVIIDQVRIIFTLVFNFRRE
jgi:2-oxoglutarate dehydrogenase E1 component